MRKIFLISLVSIIAFSNVANVFAVSMDDNSSEAVLKKEGYSKETIRMVTMQRAKLEDGKTYVPVVKNPFFVYVKNFILGKDLVDDPRDFGDRRVKF